MRSPSSVRTVNVFPDESTDVIVPVSAQAVAANSKDAATQTTRSFLMSFLL
jgi:hypothetical protein